MIIKDINNLSIKELKQLLAQVNHDLKLNKPTIKRQKKIEIIEPTEYEIANSIAKTFTNKQYAKPVENARLKADIAIQRDILDYLNSGNVIITAKSRKSKKFNSVLSYSNNKIISL
jgi:CRISPR/Cas system endoribonuclease Cas6 (RAMP superfamily)